ncbi:hypothetical protein ACQ1ZF_14485, partial [Enterococcus faecalis]
MRRFLLPAFAMLATVSAAGALAGSMEAPRSLRMNDIQVVGSHNSFKAQIPPAVMTALRARAPQMA